MDQLNHHTTRQHHSAAATPVSTISPITSPILSREEQETQDRLRLLSRPIRDVDDKFLKEVYNVICGTSPLPVQGFDHWDGRNIAVTSKSGDREDVTDMGGGGEAGGGERVPPSYFNLFDPEAFIQKQSFLIQYHCPSARLLRTEGASFVPHALSTTVASCHPVAALSKLTPKQLLLPAQLAIAPALRHNSQHAVGDYSSKASPSSAHSPTPASNNDGDIDEAGLSVEEWRHLCISATNPIAVVGGMLFHNDTKSFLFQQAPFVYSGSRKHKCLLQDVDVHFIETAALQLIKTETIIGADEEEEGVGGGGSERRGGSMSSIVIVHGKETRNNNNNNKANSGGGSGQRGHSATSQQQQSPNTTTTTTTRNRSLSKNSFSYGGGDGMGGLQLVLGGSIIGRGGSGGGDDDDIVDNHSVPDHILQQLARENAVASAKQASKRNLYCGEKLRAELRKQEDAQNAQSREMSRASTLGGRRSQHTKPRHVPLHELLPTPPPPRKAITSSSPHPPSTATSTNDAIIVAPFRKYAGVRNVAALTTCIPSSSATALPPTYITEVGGASTTMTPIDDVDDEDGNTTPLTHPLDATRTIPQPPTPLNLLLQQQQQQLPPAHLRYKKRGARTVGGSSGAVMGVSHTIINDDVGGAGRGDGVTPHPHAPTTPTRGLADSANNRPPSSIISYTPSSSNNNNNNNNNKQPTTSKSFIKSGAVSSRRMPSTASSFSPADRGHDDSRRDDSYTASPSTHITTVTAISYNARVLFQIEEFEAVITDDDSGMSGGGKTPWVVQTIRLLRQGGHAAALHGRQQFTSTPKQNNNTNSDQPPQLDCVGPVFVRAFAPSDNVDDVERAPSSLPASSAPTTPATSLSPHRDNNSRLPLLLHHHNSQHHQLPVVPSASALLGGGGGTGQKGRLMLSTMRNPVSGEEALKTCNTTLYHWCLQRDPKELGVAATVIKNTLKYFKHTFNVVRTVKRLTTAIRVMQRFVRKFLAARTRAINYMVPLWEVAEHRCAERLLKSTQHMDTTVSASVFAVIANNAARMNQQQQAAGGSGGTLLANSPTTTTTTSVANSKRGSTAAVAMATTTQTTTAFPTYQHPNPPQLPPGAHRPGAMLRYAFLAPAASEYLTKVELEITAAAPNTITGRREASSQIAALHDSIMRDSKIDAVDLLVRSAITKRLVTPTPFKIALLRMLWAKRRRLCSALLLHFNTVVAQKNDAIKLLRNTRKSSSGGGKSSNHTRGSSPAVTPRGGGTPATVDVAAVQAAHAVLSARDPVETIPASLWAQIQRSGAAGGYLLVNIKKGLQIKSALKEIGGGAAGGGAGNNNLLLPAIGSGRGGGMLSTGGAAGGRGAGKKQDAPLVQETKEERVLGRSEWAQGAKEESAPLFGFSAKVFQTLQSDARHEVGILNERQSAAVEWLSTNFVAPAVASSPPRVISRGSRGVSFSHDSHHVPTPPTTTNPSATSILATLSEPHDSDSDIEKLLHQVQAKIATFKDFYTAAELQRAKLIIMATHHDNNTMMMAVGSPRRSKGQSAVRSIRTEHKGFNNDETLVGLFLSHCREQRVVEASPLPRRRRNSSVVALLAGGGGDGSPQRPHRVVTAPQLNTDGSGGGRTAEEEASNMTAPTNGSPFAFSWYFNVNDLVREAMSFISSDLAENERTNGIEGRHRDEDFGEGIDDDDDHDFGPTKSSSMSFLARVEEKERAEVRYALNGGRRRRRHGGKSSSSSSGSILRHPMVSALIATLPPQSDQQGNTASKRGKK